MRGTLKEIVGKLSEEWGIDPATALKRVRRVGGRNGRLRDPDLKYEAVALDDLECRGLDLSGPAVEFTGGGGEPFIVFLSSYQDKDRNEVKVACVTSRGARNLQIFCQEPSEPPPRPRPPSLLDDLPDDVEP